MSEQYSTQAELDAQPDRVAARRLIASYQPQSADASNVLDTLCLHTDVWITWHELLAAASSRVSDIEKLAELSEAILRTAATAGVREEAVGEFEEVTWSDYHIETLLMESRESYESTSKMPIRYELY
jgi:accessory colonization factor AcfC